MTQDISKQERESSEAEQVRREKLGKWVAIHGRPAHLKSQISQILSKTKPGPFGEKAAMSLEVKLGMPKGHLVPAAHTQSEPTASDQAGGESLDSELAYLIQAVREARASNPAVTKSLIKQFLASLLTLSPPALSAETKDFAPSPKETVSLDTGKPD